MKFLSQVYTIARGSVGGITYTANQFAQLIARARTSPVQPGTPWQTGIRSAFDLSEALWGGLTDAQRSLWDAYADTCVYTGPLGTYTIPGRQMFIGTLALSKYINALAPAAFMPDISPPVIAGFFNPGVVQTAQYGGGTQGIAISIGIPAGEAAVCVCDCSIAFNASRYRYKGPWLSSAKEIALGPADATTLVTIDRPAQTLGKIIFSRTRCFTSIAPPGPGIPHRLSAVFYLRHTCEEPPPP